MSSPLQLQAERMRRDEQVRMAINQRLSESGEKTRLKALLREKLVECGWRDSLKDHCRGACSCARGSAALELHCVGARCAAHARYCCRTPLARCRRQHAAAPSSPTSSPQHARTRRLAHCWSGSRSRSRSLPSSHHHAHAHATFAEVIRNKGLQKITVDELVEEITPRGRATVPDEIKANMLLRIRRFLVAEREEAKEQAAASGAAASAAAAAAPSAAKP